jgi:hypothetical protein
MPPLTTWETQARVARVLPGRLEAAAVAHAETAEDAGAGKDEGKERCDEQKVDELCFGQVVTSFLF